MGWRRGMLLVVLKMTMLGELDKFLVLLGISWLIRAQYFDAG